MPAVRRIPLGRETPVSLTHRLVIGAAVRRISSRSTRAGGSPLYDTSPLQRCFRDIHAAGQHIAFSHETWKRIGKSLCGIEQPTYMI
jgi:hypothetical protein